MRNFLDMNTEEWGHLLMRSVLQYTCRRFNLNIVLSQLHREHNTRLFFIDTHYSSLPVSSQPGETIYSANFMKWTDLIVSLASEITHARLFQIVPFSSILSPTIISL
ncbi:hypothetical protein XU18_4480 [Perkinsela sp. CCAP 1560/4]|nr:hypothetical protein XU18_4480 [Perkinsela sp. CCAP 1560/4]|eukprot:KNH04270.1 hypothetical protein XU18_4480 [Perkinsela sp. CCAP 1560/4]